MIHSYQSPACMTIVETASIVPAGEVSAESVSAALSLGDWGLGAG